MNAIQNKQIGCSWEKGLENCVWIEPKSKTPLIRGKIKLGCKISNISANLVRDNLRVVAETSQLRITINNVIKPQDDYIKQEIELEAKVEGKILSRESGYEILLLPASTDTTQTFIPMHWSYLGPTTRVKAIDTWYPHYTWGDGYRKQIRTPAVTAFDNEAGAVVGCLGPHPTHIQVCPGEKKPSLCLNIPFDRPTLGPDGTESNPVLKKGEKLRYSFFLHPYNGNWETGMKRWIRYVMKNVVKDNFTPIPWIKSVRVRWIKWPRRVTKHEIDKLAENGVGAIESLPWLAPDKDMLDYIHRKGMKFLTYGYIPSAYTVSGSVKNSDYGKVWEVVVPRSNRDIANEHPDWVAVSENGKPINNRDAEHEDLGCIHMDPNVKEFREYKVNEAVEAIKNGSDGIRYDNAVVLNCHSKLHKHTMTYAEATSLMLKEIMQAVREINPEAAVVLNNAGPDLYSIADMHSTESGISSESFLYEQAGRGKRKKGSYKGAHQRMLTTRCIWGMANKPMDVYDYPGKDKRSLWRSAIFNLMHDCCSSVGWSSRFCGEVTGKVCSAVSEPVSKILTHRNIAFRYFLPGTLMILEVNGRDFVGEIEIPHHVLDSWGIKVEEKYSFISLYNGKKYIMTPVGKLSIKIDADGCDVLRLTQR